MMVSSPANVEAQPVPLFRSLSRKAIACLNPVVKLIFIGQRHRSIASAIIVVVYLCPGVVGYALSDPFCFGIVQRQHVDGDGI